jgi:hypothetical protein
MQSENESAVVDEQPSERSPEERRVLRWRFRQIRGLGFSHVEARLLAETQADLALIRRLIGDGCPLPLALKIAL